MTQIIVGILSIGVSPFVGYGARKLFLAETRGFQEVFGRELNDGENMMPSPIVGLAAIALLVGGIYLLAGPRGLI